MAATRKGVWDLQEVRDKQLASEWSDYVGTGNMYAMGRNNKGSLGQNDVVYRSSPAQITGSTWAAGGMRTGGTAGSTFAKTDGTLWSWGYSWGGAGFLNKNDYSYSSPVQVGTDTDWASDSRAKITGPRIAGFAIKTNGTLWSAGYGTKGTTGLGHNSSKSSPCQIPGSWKTVASSGYTSLGTKTAGSLWWWGENENGSSGSSVSNNTQTNSPIQVGTDTTWANVSMQSTTILATKTDGTLWAWGSNGSGALAQNNPAPSQRSSPVQIGEGTDWEIGADKFSMQGSGGAAIKTDGTLWTWGSASNGRLANNSPDGQNQSSPIQIPGTTWTSVSVMYRSAIATKTDGTAWAWGGNGDGELGLNTQGPAGRVSSPTQIPGTEWARPYLGKYDAYIITNS